MIKSRRGKVFIVLVGIRMETLFDANNGTLAKFGERMVPGVTVEIS